MMLLTNIPVPEEGIYHKQENTQAFVDGRDVGSGCLFITESDVSWLTNSGQGFGLQYPNISLHAVSRDLSAFPHECLYLMVEGKLLEEDRNEEEEEEEEEDCATTEVRFVPSDKGALDAMFSAMSDCQTLHPDPDDSPDSEAEDGQFYEGEEGVEALTEQGQATLERLNNMLERGQGDNSVPNGNANTDHTGERMETGQFDDADPGDMEQ